MRCVFLIRHRTIVHSQISRVCGRTYFPLCNSPPLAELGSISVIFRRERQSRGKRGSVMVGRRAVYYCTPHLLIQIWGAELNLLYLIRLAS